MLTRIEPKQHMALSIALAIAAMAGCDKSTGEDLAKVGDRQITSGEFEAYLKVKRIRVRDQAHADRLLKDYAEREALADAIAEQDLLDAEQTRVELNEFRKELLISRYFDKFLSEQAGTDAVTNYYNAHSDEFADKKAHVAHVLVRTNRRMSEEERKVRRTKIQEAYSKIRAGEDFGTVAQTYSEDRTSSQKGGDLGWIKEGSIDPAFSKMAFELEAGAVSQPFETPFGFHVVKVIEAPQVIRKPLSAVEGDIRYQLRAKAKKAEVERLEGLVAVEVDEGAYVPEVALEKSPAQAADANTQEAE
jgi:peptidyl-prolyl cis-trans isomerase C